MNRLITGSLGHLGEAICGKLMASNISYIGIEVQPGAFTDKVGSISDRSFVDSCLENVSFVSA